MYLRSRAGPRLGVASSLSVGFDVGSFVGSVVGSSVGSPIGASVGSTVGSMVGLALTRDSNDGIWVGRVVTAFLDGVNVGSECWSASPDGVSVGSLQASSSVGCGVDGDSDVVGRVGIAVRGRSAACPAGFVEGSVDGWDVGMSVNPMLNCTGPCEGCSDALNNGKCECAVVSGDSDWRMDGLGLGYDDLDGFGDADGTVDGLDVADGAGDAVGLDTAGDRD